MGRWSWLKKHPPTYQTMPQALNTLNLLCSAAYMQLSRWSLFLMLSILLDGSWAAGQLSLHLPSILSIICCLIFGSLLIAKSCTSREWSSLQKISLPIVLSGKCKNRIKILTKNQRTLYVYLLENSASSYLDLPHRGVKMPWVNVNSIVCFFKNWWFVSGFDFLELQRHEIVEKPWFKFSLMWWRLQFWVEL